MLNFESLHPTCVHIWYLPTGTPLANVQSPDTAEKLLNILSEKERTRFREYRVMHAGENFLLARSLLRLILGKYLLCSAREIEFEYNAFGRPQLGLNFITSGVSFNLSHCKGMVAIAVSLKRDVGIDVESSKREIDCLSISKNVLDLRELSYLKSQRDIIQNKIFLKYWTLKEAYAKARGIGLSLPFDEIVFELECVEPYLVKTPQNEHYSQNWRFSLLNLGVDHILAVAATVRCNEHIRFTIKKVDHPITLLQNY